MVGRQIIADKFEQGDAVAVLNGNVLTDFLFSVHTSEPQPDTIIQAIADRNLKGQGAWVVRLPGAQHGYLRTKLPLEQGEKILVQVSGYGAKGKLVPVRDRLELSGKFSILINPRQGVSVSRKIRDSQENRHFRHLAESAIKGHRDWGIIVRHSCRFASDQEIVAEIDKLSHEFSQILSLKMSQAPALVREPSPILDQAISDWNCQSISIDGSMGSFERYFIPDHLDAFSQTTVELKNGANLVIEPTDALVAVDVNSQKASLSPNAAFETNLAAARELPRQLRVRGLGGQIVVDFASTANKKRAQVKEVLEKAFSLDCVSTTLVGWTGLGHFELHRQRKRLPITRWFQA